MMRLVGVKMVAAWSATCRVTVAITTASLDKAGRCRFLQLHLKHSNSDYESSCVFWMERRSADGSPRQAANIVAAPSASGLGGPSFRDAIWTVIEPLALHGRRIPALDRTPGRAKLEVVTSQPINLITLLPNVKFLVIG
jgi:hypothetical protein